MASDKDNITDLPNLIFMVEHYHASEAKKRCAAALSIWIREAPPFRALMEGAGMLRGRLGPGL
jgi:hypothetical protein